MFCVFIIEQAPCLFQTLLRIWDCFLLEGPKVLFRFSLAILKMNERSLLAKQDTVSIMRQLKAAAKLCFDVDHLFQVRKLKITCTVLVLFKVLLYSSNTIYIPNRHPLKFSNPSLEDKILLLSRPAITKR